MTHRSIVVKGARRTKAQRPPGALRRKAPLRRGLFYVRRTPFYIYIFFKNIINYNNHLPSNIIKNINPINKNT